MEDIERKLELVMVPSPKMVPEKKKPCKTCKKKKPITKLPDVMEINEYIPSEADIKLAYLEINNNADLSKREFVNKVYKFLFNEEFDFACGSCVNIQSRKLNNYINATFNR